MHFKSNPFYKQTNLNVDRDNNIIKNVVMVQFGVNKNNTYFNEKYLQDFAVGANEITQGVKSRFGHPNMCSTTLGSFIGRYKDFKYEDKKVVANLHLDPISKKTQVEGKGISMFEYVMDMAESNPDMFGNSIHIPTPKFEKDKIEIEEVKYAQHLYNGIVASDIVDSPAATDALFNNSNDLGIIMTEFLDENPSIFSAIEKNPKIIEDFFNRYENYKSINMNFLDKLRKKFSDKETFDIEVTTGAGDIVTVVTENENPEEGDSVVDADGNAVKEGDLVISDGTTWVIADGGKISEIKPKESPSSDDDEPTNAEVMQSVNDLAETFNTFKNQYKKDFKENQDGIELVAESLNEKFNTLAKSVKSKSPDYQQTKKGKGKKFSSNYDPTKVKERRDARNPKKD